MSHIYGNSKSCCGCTACYVACPRKAIEMVQDQEGFMIPSVKETDCINCGICEHICPAINNHVDSNIVSDTNAFAFQSNDDAIRYKSASGAFFPALAKYVLEEKAGYVSGCVLDEHLMPKHIVTNDVNDIKKMQDSKYVQSNIDESFGIIVSLLKDDKWVLFTGTSCQVAGLLSLVKHKGISSEKLITVDFFCHGTPSPLMWNEFLSFYQKETGHIIKGVRFRNKKYLWGRASRGTHAKMKIYYENRFGKKKSDFTSLASTVWYSFFWSNLCLRQYCYHCPYASIKKPADITMADFWGIEDIDPDFNDKKGCSLVLTRNKKADCLIKALNNVSIKEVDLEKAIKKQGNASKPSNQPNDRDTFWKDYQLHGFEYNAKKYFDYSYKRKIKNSIKNILFFLHLRGYKGM